MTTLHNHTLGEEPRLFDMLTRGIGPLEQAAAGRRATLGPSAVEHG